ncbi:MAG: hypothetical protein H6719_15400 [Sandaracinaceae bacterium]|nr:hypothetical protein [Sandaracinaceae bacterium]
MRLVAALSVASCVTALGCDGSTLAVDASVPDAGPSWDPACENIDPAHCLLPWPSDRFLVDGEVALPAQGLPADRRGARVDPGFLPRRDGFELLPTLVTVTSPAPDPASLSDQDHVADSLGPDATAVIVNVATGERVPCWAELDGWPDVDPARVPLYVRPAVRLDPSTRYAVGLRGLMAPGGAAIEPSPWFRALRDETPLADSDVEGRRDELRDVFEALAAAGVPRDELVVAWGFTTASEASITGDLIAMRDDLLSTPVGGCAVTAVEDAEAGDALPELVWRRVHGTFRVPLYLVGATASSSDEARIHRDAAGAPIRGEEVEVPFLALLPETLRARVADGGEPGRVIVYGHGILGSRLEATAGFMTEHASELEAVIFATDWWGMAEDDLSRLVLALSHDFSTFPATTERLHQGIVNVLALMRAARSTCAALPELAVPLADGSAAPSYDPATLAYYGNSQGSILGTVVAGVAPDVERFVLGVGGVGWPMIMKRSDAWRGFGGILMGTYEDPLERAILVAVSGLAWAPVDGSTYAPHLIADPLPGSVARRLLLQIGVGDVAVSNTATHVLARTAGVPLTVPSVETPFGLETTTDPAPSGLTIFSLPGVAAIPPGSHDPGVGTITHEAVRTLPAAHAEIDRFLAPDGDVAHPCDGPCDPD